MPASTHAHAKLPGVLYARTASGIELPILDVSHPVFQVTQSDEALHAEANAWAAGQARTGFVGRLFNRYALPRLLKRSRIGRGLLAADGGHLDGLTTYLLKLGPQALHSADFNDMDRRISGSIAGTLLRVRARDMAEAQARQLLPLLLPDPARPLHLVNIAGGPASDSLNCLRILAADPKHPLAQRPIRIHLLDLSTEGPQFAAASLAVWMGEEGALKRLDLQMELKAYDWTHAESRYPQLAAVPSDALVLVSSEGGLFDYADDGVVLANLKAIRENTPGDGLVFGTINLPEGPGKAVRQGSKAALHPRTLADVATVAGIGGWEMRESWERPAGAGFCLGKAAA